MSSDVHVVFPTETIRRAAQTMKEIGAGFLPVGENDRLVGIISLGDVSRSDGATDDSGAALKEITQPGGRHIQG